MKHHGGPLLGYNNNIPYKGQVYHVQTEDSGSKRPHVITHLFADGGRIIKTRKTSYAQFVGSDDLPEKVKALMREQHKGMVLSLRDGEFDALIDPDGAQTPPPPESLTEAAEVPPSAPIELLEEAAVVDDDQFQEEIERISTTEGDDKAAAAGPRSVGSYSFVGDHEPAKASGRSAPRRMRSTKPKGDSDLPAEDGPPAEDVTAIPERRRGSQPSPSPVGRRPFGAGILSGRRLDELVAAFLQGPR